MSFVSIIATDKWISAVSDSNLLEVSEKGDMKRCLGNKPSFTRISKRQFIACTGSAALLNRIKHNMPFKFQPYVVNEALLSELEQEVKKFSTERQDVLLVIADLAEKSICRMISNRKDDDWVSIVPERGRAGTLFLAGKEIDEQKIKFIYEECNRMLGSKQRDLKNVIIVQKKLNRLAMKFDSSIGSRVFQLTIKAD
ncbi:hypothetical protein NIE88_07770 [Sporolactobacillus shoreicorticis]|uniref:Uncharacterized protein n=1 Tax=Sporolactobacillus shoreicorticis TaxID=1923877 RepID=A0ABW5S685_9BACL|nr:hypothetical protein [Sporolactobacillus shoreicorticis]MCO7125665.1 hypothetical protein [Sporolactobacillus shoreicorticis]